MVSGFLFSNIGVVMKENKTYIERKILLKTLLILLDITQADIAKELGYTSSVISRYFNDERRCLACDLYLIEKLFGIKVIDFQSS